MKVLGLGVRVSGLVRAAWESIRLPLLSSGFLVVEPSKIIFVI